uniref:Uncharacterized protein LOC111136257 n=1 Tax=Crassostrea virginica TaxID=6565 RepID=A0A8B8ERY2_CRAVI|nr:uncharacterized protein LOC111136257 [Crassostrea virginica]
MTICFVFGCNHQGLRRTCKMFRFPSNPGLAKKWEKLSRRKDRTLNVQGDRICDCHFKDRKKENGPTIFPWSSEKIFDFTDPCKIRRKERTETETTAVCTSSPTADEVVHDVSYGFCHQHPALSDSIHTYNIKPEILEIKCPFSAKDKIIPEAIESISEFCLETQAFCGEETYRLNETHPYFDQVQGQLYITGKSACDFMVWTPKDCTIIRITQDPDWQPNISVLTDCYFSKFVPYLQQL